MFYDAVEVILAAAEDAGEVSSGGKFTPKTQLPSKFKPSWGAGKMGSGISISVVDPANYDTNTEGVYAVLVFAKGNIAWWGKKFADEASLRKELNRRYYHDRQVTLWSRVDFYPPEDDEFENSKFVRKEDVQ